MFLYFWGNTPYNGASGLGIGLFGRDPEPNLPEEVRAAIEEHKDEIYNEDDLRHMAENLMLRR